MLCYYHTGTAVQAADIEGPAFWDTLINIYPTAPRASERRHFRGNAGMSALRHMQTKWPDPATFFDGIPRDYTKLIVYCGRELLQFGAYFQLKIADYMDRCLRMPMDQFSMVQLANNLPSLPAKAVKLLYPGETLNYGFQKALNRVQGLGMMAPPAFDRPIGPAEVETILCDWKRAKTGSSWIGADVEDKRHAFQNSGPRAINMAEWMPPNPLRTSFKLALE